MIPIKGQYPDNTEIYKALMNMEKLKWAIKRTPENSKEINAWANKQKRGQVYESANGYIHSEPVRKDTIPLFTPGLMAGGFTEITIEQFREITNPTKNMEKKLTKQELIGILEKKISGTVPFSTRDGVYQEVLELVKQLDEPKPELLPFQWPVPDGMEVVAFNGDIAEDCCRPDVLKNVPVLMGGQWKTMCQIDLFLRPVEPEMVTMWVKLNDEGNWYGFPSKEMAEHCGRYDKDKAIFPVTFPKPQP